jgi:phosphatidylglycerol lysyltransferase
MPVTGAVPRRVGSCGFAGRRSYLESSDGSALQRARALVLGEGWNTTSFQILNPGFRLWFSEAEDAVVGWVERRGVRVVAGAPICAYERLPGVVAEFEADARYARERVCYVAAQDRLVAALPTTSHRAIVVGAQPVLRPDVWDAVYRSHASLRAQVSRAHNKGVRVTEWPTARGSDHPELKRCLGEWLAGRGLPPLRFLVEPETLGRLQGRRLFVAERADTPVAFCVLSPVPRRNGWLAEQIVRGRRAPNGTAELLVDAALRAVAAEDATFFTLGGAFLSKRANATQPPPGWLRLAFFWLRQHGKRFYNTGGLEAFKAKFRPIVWEPLYLVANERRLRPSVVYAAAAAFTGGSPALVGARGIARAARIELR